MKKILIFILTFWVGNAAAQTQLSGKVADEKGEAQLDAQIAVKRNGTIITGAVADFEGLYSITLDPGTYDVEVQMFGFKLLIVKNVIAKNGKNNELNAVLQYNIPMSDDTIVMEYKKPLVDLDNTSRGIPHYSREFTPTKDSVTSIVASSSNCGGEGEGITVRSSRDDGQLYMIDGKMVRASELPAAKKRKKLKFLWFWL